MQHKVIEARPASRPSLERPPSEAELGKAIARRRKADDRAAATKATAAEAERLRADAAKRADEIRAAQESALSAAKTHHAKAISEALRAGKPVPGTPRDPSAGRFGSPGLGREAA